MTFMKITAVYSENLIKPTSILYGRNVESGPVMLKQVPFKI
jgi:hypothetical protein